MVVNQKAVKVINKIFEAGITEEKDISAMTLDEILEIQGITVAACRVSDKAFGTVHISI